MWGSLAGEILRVRSLRGQRIFAAIGLGLGVVWYGAPNASAQVAPEYQYTPDVFQDEIPRGETVRTRQRPELEPLGLHVGSFFMFPSITNGISFTDNVYATESHKKSDFIYTLAPQVNVRSDWNTHSIELAAGGRLGYHFDQTGEDYQDAFASAAGRLDVSSHTVVHGKLNLNRDHEERGDPNDVNGSEPTVFYTYAGTVDAAHRFNRLTLSVAGDIRRIDYDNTPAANNTTIDNSDRNRVEYRPGVKAAYEFSPGYSGFIRAEGDIRHYDKTYDSGGFKRDSTGFDVVGGASVDLTGLLFGDFFAGIRQRYFDDTRFDSITGPVVGSTLTWIPTGLTTVTLKIDNQVIESTGVNTSGYSSTSVTLGVDHELLRNLILSANLGGRYDDFEGISRTDKYVSGSLGADYLWNRYLTLSGRYGITNRDSNAANTDYTSNLFSLFLTAQL